MNLGNLTEHTNFLVSNLQANNEEGVKVGLEYVGFEIYQRSASSVILEYYEDVIFNTLSQQEQTRFWKEYIKFLHEKIENRIIYGLFELFMYIDMKYSDELLNHQDLRRIFLDILPTLEDESIQYQIYSYLSNWPMYNEQINELINNGTINSKMIISLADAINKTNDFIVFFIKIVHSWGSEGHVASIEFFIEFLQDENNLKNLMRITDKIKALYRSLEDNKKEKRLFHKFFMVVLQRSIEKRALGAIELVITIYNVPMILNEMLEWDKDFISLIAKSYKLTNDRHINELGINICSRHNFIELTSSFLDEISNERESIDIIDIYKKKGIINDLDSNKLAAREKIKLTIDDLIKLNEIHRKIINTGSTYIEKFNENFTYSANEARKMIGLDEGVDLVSAIKKIGIQIYEEEFDTSEFTGCLFKFPLLKKAGIVINKNMSQGRISFTLAHELGHFINDKSELTNFSNDTMYVSYIISKNERSIDMFASDLLLPEKHIKDKVKHCDINLELVKSISEEYSTSIEAALIKCINVVEEKYCMAVYTNNQLSYFYCNDTYYDDIGKSEIKSCLDQDTFAFKLMEQLEEYYDGHISDIKQEDISLWFNNFLEDNKISTQVYVQYKKNRTILVLLQFPFEE